MVISASGFILCHDLADLSKILSRKTLFEFLMSYLVLGEHNNLGDDKLMSLEAFCAITTYMQESTNLLPLRAHLIFRMLQQHKG